MPTTQAAFYLAPDLAIHLIWSAHIASFTQEWRHRLQVAEVSCTQAEEHMIEAASMVLSTVEQLDERTAQVLTDLYRLSGQLPAPTDKLLVGPLELRVEERQFATSRQGGSEQVAVTYYLKIERYRYEVRRMLEEQLATSFAFNPSL
ncbi:MAG: hypothetical protein ACRYF0_03890 [Janthinobacterium lividum]